MDDLLPPIDDNKPLALGDNIDGWRAQDRRRLATTLMASLLIHVGVAGWLFITQVSPWVAPPQQSALPLKINLTRQAVPNQPEQPQASPLSESAKPVVAVKPTAGPTPHKATPTQATATATEESATAKPLSSNKFSKPTSSKPISSKPKPSKSKPSKPGASTPIPATPPVANPIANPPQTSTVAPSLLVDPEFSNAPDNNLGTQGSVFNPTLKRQLSQARANKKSTEQIGSALSYRASSGNEIYVHGDNCSKIVAAKDDHDQERWGVGSRCAWVKSESEQFMDRVNQALQMRVNGPN